MTSPISVTRLQMETAWLSRLKAAERHYNAAVAQYEAVFREQQASLPSARDAAHALWQASVEKSGARREYQHVLNTFTRLVVNGELPPEE
jgi:hypothetical protein